MLHRLRVCEVVLAGVFLHGITGAAPLPSYEVRLVAPVTSLNAVDFRMSQSALGTVAFSGNDAQDGLSKVFVSACPLSPMSRTYAAAPACGNPIPISFFSAGRTFSGASIDDQHSTGARGRSEETH